MSAVVQPRRTRNSRLVRALTAVGTGAAVLALPLIGAADASAAPSTATTTAATTPAGYPDNLDGWIRESLAIMAEKHIPGTYNGIYRNIIRESSGNPKAINLWDSNAAKGIPSKGLLQVIDPTFKAYHVAGTSFDIYDPVANITAACNYAAARYGSIDNVFGAY
ncbi:transglycosylase SLT domain-containing protein [Streptomyces olivaceoviridis]|uniref:transglycosylase SLT domain-containing protein n=1 Tax=Streptomyces olivaceoviridis TaxID=1921 RepID=UPI0033AB9DA9